mgnify:FL=1|jgi:hypothetical protein
MINTAPNTVTLRLTKTEFIALKEAVMDIREYVETDMFSSPKGLAAFNRIIDKIENIELV